MIIKFSGAFIRGVSHACPMGVGLMAPGPKIFFKNPKALLIAGKVHFELDELNEKELSNIDSRKDGKVEVIDVTVNESVLSDANGLPMHTEGSPHSFYIGEPAVVYEIKNASGDLIPGGTGTFEIHMTKKDLTILKKN